MFGMIPDTIDFSKYLIESEGQQRVRPAGGYIDEMAQDIGRPRIEHGESLPWVKARKLFRFRPGEVTLWAGVNGHGKSILTGFVAMHLLARLQRVCIASFEMKPRRTLQRMLRQWSLQDIESLMHEPEAAHALRDIYTDFKAQVEGRLWFYDQQGTVDAARVVSVARYCAKELRVQHIFIDSLMKCVKAEDDYNGQKYLVDELTAIARDHECHIHLVHHIRKLENELKKPDKTDVKGSGAITDQVDNVLLVWRNKAEIRKEGDPDAALICCKQRNGEWEGGMNLWFDRESQQYLGESGDRPIDFAQEVL